eukprot:TRINITY_DN4957_c0_g2_i1.p1 TRINITY_DN4957_c0_g2~~TRINITY_DN4957_c0_g2_i1.p1  ORF type:complete len:677 (-),score=199.30 TRINITY_DN4957_c0_g2_i1:94-2124(-)
MEVLKGCINYVWRVFGVSSSPPPEATVEDRKDPELENEPPPTYPMEAIPEVVKAQEAMNELTVKINSLLNELQQIENEIKTEKENKIKAKNKKKAKVEPEVILNFDSKSPREDTPKEPKTTKEEAPRRTKQNIIFRTAKTMQEPEKMKKVHKKGVILMPSVPIQKVAGMAWNQESGSWEPSNKWRQSRDWSPVLKWDEMKTQTIKQMKNRKGQPVRMSTITDLTDKPAPIEINGMRLNPEKMIWEKTNNSEPDPFAGIVWKLDEMKQVPDSWKEIRKEFTVNAELEESFRKSSEGHLKLGSWLSKETGSDNRSFLDNARNLSIKKIINDAVLSDTGRRVGEEEGMSSPVGRGWENLTIITPRSGVPRKFSLTNSQLSEKLRPLYEKVEVSRAPNRSPRIKAKEEFEIPKINLQNYPIKKPRRSLEPSPLYSPRVDASRTWDPRHPRTDPRFLDSNPESPRCDSSEAEDWTEDFEGAPSQNITNKFKQWMEMEEETSEIEGLSGNTDSINLQQILERKKESAIGGWDSEEWPDYFPTVSPPNSPGSVSRGPVRKPQLPVDPKLVQWVDSSDSEEDDSDNDTDTDKDKNSTNEIKSAEEIMTEEKEDDWDMDAVGQTKAVPSLSLAAANPLGASAEPSNVQVPQPSTPVALKRLLQAINEIEDEDDWDSPLSTPTHQT